MHQLPEWLELSVAVAVLLASAAHDVAARTVPNWMPAIVATDGIAIRLQQQQLLHGLGVCLLVFLACVLLWRRNLFGGGDVKLLSAAALLVPPFAVPDLLLTIALVGGGVALLYCLLRVLVAGPAAGRPRRRLARILRVERRRIRRGQSLPYASAIAAGALLIMFRT